MTDQRQTQRLRTLKRANIVFNNRRSLIECVVRNLSSDGACLEVQSLAGIPERFDLAIDGDTIILPCHAVWKSINRIGVSFHHARSSGAAREERPDNMRAAVQQPANLADLVRGDLLALRAALDDVPFGVVLLDRALRAQFINRAFRRMWRLSDTMAETKPPFVALLYHGCETRAYAIDETDLDMFVEERVAHVKVGSPTPLDLRLASGEIIRFQCTVLPNGGRMLSYTYVTDIVRHSDQLEVLRAALDNIKEGIVLLDADLNTEFMNRAVRELWKVSDEQADSKPPYSVLVNDARITRMYGVPAEDLDGYIARRIESVRAGDPTPMDLRVADGRIVRSQCNVLPGGGRMLTYTDVTDLVLHAEELERLATTDGMTGLYNRRHFMRLAQAEWTRFARYHRPLSLLVIDIDRLKAMNDGFGHDAGDQAIRHVADLCREEKRGPDIFAWIGGDEFAMLLPETDLAQTGAVAERLRQRLFSTPCRAGGGNLAVTVSIGAAQGTTSMSSFDELMKLSDQVLYMAKAKGGNRTLVATSRQSIAFDRAAE